MIRYARLATPLGTLIATAAGGALTGLYFEGRPHAPRVGADWVEDAAAAPLRACAKQLGEYFDGVRKTFDLPLTPDGSAFQRRVWIEIAAIPYGETVTYGELAATLADGTTAQEVGQAVGRNPLSIVVPCHCVIGANGKLTGFAGGLDTKAWLLAHEHHALF